MEALAAAEENLTVLCDNHVCAAQMDSACVIKSVTSLNIRTLAKTKFNAKIFIDCTGDDQFIPGIKNEDPNDPCLTAQATASSVKKDEMFQSMQGADGDLMPLDIPRAVIACALRTQGDVNGLYLKLHSAHSEPKMVTMRAFTRGNGRDNFCVFGETLTVQAEVPPMGESWVKFPLCIPVEEEFQDRFYIQVWLEPTEGISWRSVKDLTIFHRAGEMNENGEWVIEGCRSYRHSFTEPVEKLADCGAENVINGYSAVSRIMSLKFMKDRSG